MAGLGETGCPPSGLFPSAAWSRGTPRNDEVLCHPPWRSRVTCGIGCAMCGQHDGGTDFHVLIHSRQHAWLMAAYGTGHLWRSDRFEKVQGGMSYYKSDIWIVNNTIIYWKVNRKRRRSVFSPQKRIPSL